MEKYESVVVICDSCKNSKHVGCSVKYKFKQDGKTQSEFIKILGGYFQKCDYYESK